MLRYVLLFMALSSPLLGQSPAPAASKEATPKSRPAAESGTTDALASADALMTAHRYDEAISAYKELIGKDPKLAGAHIGLMRSLLRSHQLDDAEASAAAAVAAMPDAPLLHAWYGEVEFRVGKFSDAEREYRAALKLDPNNARGLFGIARLYRMLSMPRTARLTLARAHELAPSDEQITQAWLASLPYAQRLQAMNKPSGDQDGAEQSARVKLATAFSQKKPWVLVGGPRHVEIPLPLIGRHEMWTADVSRKTTGTFSSATGYGLHVKFNDKAATDLLLDTGASGIVIGHGIAEKAGAVKIADSYFGGIGDKGVVRGYIAWVDKIIIGSLEFHDCVVEVSNRGDITDDGGLIGADVFDEFLVTLNFQDKKLVLAPLPNNPNPADPDGVQDRYIAPEMQGFTKFMRFGHDILLPVVVSDKVLANFILDTGAGLTIISPALATRVTKIGGSQWQMKGVSGRVNKVLSGSKVILQFAQMRVESHDLPVLSLDHISDSEGTEISGLISILTLSQLKMTIDYRDGVISLTPYEFQKARE